MDQSPRHNPKCECTKQQSYKICEAKTTKNERGNRSTQLYILLSTMDRTNS